MNVCCMLMDKVVVANFLNKVVPILNNPFQPPILQHLWEYKQVDCKSSLAPILCHKFPIENQLFSYCLKVKNA